MERRQFNAGLFAGAGLTAFGGLQRASAQPPQARSAIYAAIGPQLRRVRIDGGVLAFEGGPIALPAPVMEAWQHPSKAILYVGSSNFISPDETEQRHYVNALRIGASGDLEPFGRPVPLPHRPIFLTVDHRGEYLISVAPTPSSVFVHRLAADGAIGEVVRQQVENLDLGVYPHQVRMMPSGRAVLIPARGHEMTATQKWGPGAIKIFGFADGQLTNRQSVAPHGGAHFQVRHAEFHPSGALVYVTLEPQNLLHTFAIKDDRLSEAPLFTSTTLAAPEAATGGQMAGALRLHPSGRALYVANRGPYQPNPTAKVVSNGTENSIAVYAIDPKSGEPKLIQSIATQSFHPRTMAVTLDGRWLMAASTAPGYMRVEDHLVTTPAALTLFEVADDDRLTLRHRLDVDTTPGQMFWSGVVRY